MGSIALRIVWLTGSGFAMVLVGYKIGAPLPHELAELGRIERDAAEIFPDDLAPELRGQAMPVSFFGAAASAGRLWVAREVETELPVGFAAVTLLDGSAHLQEVDVLPAHGRKGIGRALVLFAVEWAQESGFAFLSLTTFRHLPWNAPFYASLGFIEIDERDLGPEIRELMRQEIENGLDPSLRVAMRLALSA